MIDIQNIVVSKFDANRWVISTPNGSHILINENSKKLLDILQREDDSTALAQFNLAFNQSLSQSDFKSLIEVKFKGLNKQNEKTEKYSYLSLRFTILNSKVAGLLAQPFSFLFKPLNFWLILISTIIFNTVITLKYFSLDITLINLKSAILYFSIVYSSMLIHELGHIAACRKFKIKHGEIGFGFYLVFPVLYADVTNVWMLAKNKRIITNLAGIKLELLYSTILCCIFLITSNLIFLYCSITIFIKALTELNPFIRYDGYWVLSDITDTPNLLPKSTAAILSFFKRGPFNNRYGSLSIFKYYALLCYGISNLVILTLYVTIIIAKYNYQILQFPFDIMIHAQKITQGNFSEIFLIATLDNLLILGLYVLVGKLIFAIFIKGIPIWFNRVSQNRF